MGIKKYTSFEQARQDQWVYSPDEEYYKRIRKFYQFISRINPPQHPRGIFKYRNISEASKHSIRTTARSAVKTRNTGHPAREAELRDAWSINIRHGKA